MTDGRELDALDVALLSALQDSPRAGDLELSRLTGVARGTVTARLRRLEERGVARGYGPDVHLRAAGFGVQGFPSLEVAPGAVDALRCHLVETPRVPAAHSTTRSCDV